ncbi:MAG: sensor histidine kinase [Armatimonadota bacterium]
MNRRPSLLRYFLRQNIIAVSITLGLVLLIVLFLADHLALQSAAQGLAQEISDVDERTLFIPGGQGRGGRIVLDSKGRISADSRGWRHRGGMGAGRQQMNYDAVWALAPDVLANGEKRGISVLPWTGQSMVWAARTVTVSSGEEFILVVWSRTSNVRGAARTIYILIIIAIGLAFLINTGFLAYTIRGVTRTLNDVTSAGRKMVNGDFNVSIPSQTTAELDDLSKVITDLALHLDLTLTELKTEQMRLTKLEQAQRQFVADASHELRAPLSAMTITLDAWHDGLLREEEYSEALDTLRSESKRLGRMVSQLLDLSRIQSGRQLFKNDVIDVCEMSNRVLETMNSTQGAPIDIDIPDNLPGVIADPDALHRILRNLLDNARRFTPAEGRITIWAKVDGDRVRIGVTDNGCGIPEESIHRMWDRFARAERERAGDATGTGLGLAIVKALVEAMDGTVGLDSLEGKGTTVWVSLNTAKNVSEK